MGRAGGSQAWATLDMRRGNLQGLTTYFWSPVSPKKVGRERQGVRRKVSAAVFGHPGWEKVKIIGCLFCFPSIDYWDFLLEIKLGICSWHTVLPAATPFPFKVFPLLILFQGEFSQQTGRVQWVQVNTGKIKHESGKFLVFARWPSGTIWDFDSKCPSHLF